MAKFKYLIIFLDGDQQPVGTNDDKVAATANADDSFGVIVMDTCEVLGDASRNRRNLPIVEQTIYELG